MTAQALPNPLPNFIGLDGLPLSGGSVYFGEANQDPRQYPKAVYYDAALTIPVTQPLRTTAGYLYRNGAPTDVWGEGDFSVMALDAAGRQVLYKAAWVSVANDAAAAATAAAVAAAQPFVDDAEAAKDAAETAETNAETAQAAAEAARDSAWATARMYASTAAALADGTLAVGSYFSVVSASANEISILYKKDAGPVATDTGKRSPTAVAVTAAATHARRINKMGTAKYTNLFDAASTTAGFNVSTLTGALNADASRYASDYTRVTPGGTVTFNKALYGATNIGIAYYDFAQTFVSGVAGVVAANTPLTVPAGAFYIRVAFANAVVKQDTIAVDGSTMPTEYSPFDYPEALRARKSFAADQKAVVGLVNIFDKTTITDNSSLGNNTIGTIGTFYVTAYMPVVQADFITFNAGASPLGATNGVHFYDKDLAFLNIGAVPVASTPIAVPAGAAWARATFPKATAPALTLMAVQGSTLPSRYVPYGIPNQNETLELSRDITRAYAHPINLYDPALATDGFLLQSTGASANAGFSITDYMPVKAGGTITLVQAWTGGSAYGMHFYDNRKVYLSSINAPHTAGQVMAVPADAFYARTSFATVNKAIIGVLDGTVSPVAHYTSYQRVTLADVRRWANMNFAFFGDSITAGGSWPDTFCAYLKANKTLNVAISSTGMESAFNLAANGQQATSSSIANIDVCVCMYGTNNFTANTPLGTIADSSATASFYGYTRKFFETLLGWKPTLKIVMFTVLKRTSGPTNSNGNTVRDFCEAIIAVSKEFGAPVLDLNYTSGLNALNLATWTSDGLHPTIPAGSDALIAKPAIGFFNSLG